MSTIFRGPHDTKQELGLELEYLALVTQRKPVLRSQHCFRNRCAKNPLPAESGTRPPSGCLCSDQPEGSVSMRSEKQGRSGLREGWGDTKGRKGVLRGASLPFGLDQAGGPAHYWLCQTCLNLQPPGVI